MVAIVDVGFTGEGCSWSEGLTGVMTMRCQGKGARSLCVTVHTEKGGCGKEKRNPKALIPYKTVTANGLGCWIAILAFWHGLTIQLNIGNPDKSIILRSSSSRVEFPGYRAVFTDIVTEAVQDKDSDEFSRDQTFGVLNSLKTGDPLHVVQTEPNQHHTQPPPRYSEASLVKKLEELGIGRPSTYASTIKVLQGGESDDFSITIGLHQGSTLSPYLFTLILDVLTEQIQEIASRCMLFVDDIVLLGESREELNERLETWRRALETHGFRLSRSKSEYMECKFNKRRRVSNSEVKIGDHIIPQVTRFKYLGSVIQDDGEIEGDVNHRIQAGWMKWRKASGVLCDAKVPIKLKGKFYRTAVRPAILYGTECWAVKSQHENKVGVAEMRMLRWMCGKTRQDKIRNEAIRERVGVAPIVEKMVENRLRWFGHVERRPVDSVVRRVDQMERRQTIRGRGRPKKTIREVIKKDLELNDLDRSMVLDRTLWRKLIHVADPT
ncbi:DNA topoisomerase 1 [Glycine soja]